MTRGFRFSIDRGGTFTDVYAETPKGSMVTKLLSEDPENYTDAPREGIRRILEEVTGKPHPKSEKVDSSQIESIRMGTTVATNALLERKGEKIAFVTTSGFGDVLQIGNQSRPHLFDLKIQKLSVLYQTIIEIDERMVLHQPQSNQESEDSLVSGITGEKLKIGKPLDEKEVREKLTAVYNQGIRSLAVALMHSYLYADHEKAIAKIAKEIGFGHVSLSSEVMPMAKLVPRGYTTCADAYLTPCIKSYITSFQQGFDDNIKDVNVMFMQSDGGLAHVDDFNGSRAILSGPAGGVVGYGKTTFERLTCLPVIGFDMGGTSTDVSRFSGSFEHVFETSIAGITIQAPQLDINTVAAGGGSRLFFRSGMFVVGPESVGAHPGPVCYRKGGFLAITDANLLLGRICVDMFPKIFGPNEDEPLHIEATRHAFNVITKEINNYRLENWDSEAPYAALSAEEVAYGFIQVANESMCRPIRALTQAKGYDTSAHALACFGGAGGQHAAAIARALGMKEIFVHEYAGILSAYGIALADVVTEVQKPFAKVFDESIKTDLAKDFTVLKREALAKLEQQGFDSSNCKFELYLNMRYEKTDCALMILDGPDNTYDFENQFLAHYQREFGFTIPGRAIIIDDIRVRGIGLTNISLDIEVEAKTEVKDNQQEVTPLMMVECYFAEGFTETPVYAWEDLVNNKDFVVDGPAIVTQQISTILIEPNTIGQLVGDTLKMTITNQNKKSIDASLDPIQLGIFSHRFMSIAEQMGRTLQRTSISTNIKERLDFSCALFGPDGGLVANAPHIPVHLGAMQEAVKYQIKVVGDKMKRGDVFVSNHPNAGGSHLPDITVITPVFQNDMEGHGPVFYVASRGHHADIGGITPGSMPPNSKSLADEGFAVKSFRLVQEEIFQEEDITKMLLEAGARCVSDNISDLKAQVAANNCGITLVNELIDQYDLNVVHAYMTYIQTNASNCVQDSLKKIFKENIIKNTDEVVVLYGEDHMDDGTVIALNLNIKKDGTAVFDFTGTGWEVMGNLNAPKAVVYSAAIYCLRCLVPYDIPLNQGCLNPVSFVIPSNTIINPSAAAAVVGGNVLTSQRIVDVILKTLKVCAASQGCMNNLTFGDENVGYYETIAGGAGAGPTWNGCSGVHTHMTNTRITDPEIIERRYPVILRQFSLRPDSGGKGQYDGGNGVIREIEFRKELTVSLLTERRAFQPYGMHGGSPGERGLNILYRSGCKHPVSLGGKATITTGRGDRLVILSPGGGGYGDPSLAPAGGENGTPYPALQGGSINEYKSRQEQC